MHTLRYNGIVVPIFLRVWEFCAIKRVLYAGALIGRSYFFTGEKE